LVSFQMDWTPALVKSYMRPCYLKGALQKEAGQVLWDYGPEVTDCFKELLRTLKGRFGGANQSHKFRMEIRNRWRKDGESLQSLHSDVRRLPALAFPDLQHSARETIACDYFIDALANADFALKVRERASTNLDSALLASVFLVLLVCCFLLMFVFWLFFSVSLFFIFFAAVLYKVTKIEYILRTALQIEVWSK